MPHILERTTFETSRLLEFFSEKELSMQMGCPKEQWPLALLKELMDNALDASETAGLLPEIEVMVEPDSVSVRDHGPGVPVATLERSLDYVVRVSDKANYVSPTRGQLGNALKCLWAAPFVASGEAGYVEVVTGGFTHRIAVMLDRIAQQSDLQYLTLPDGFVKNGTRINLIWPGIAIARWPHRLSPFFTKAPLTWSSNMERSIPTPACATSMASGRGRFGRRPLTGRSGSRVIPPRHTGIPPSGYGR